MNRNFFGRRATFNRAAQSLIRYCSSLALGFCLHAAASAQESATPLSPEDGGPRNWKVATLGDYLNLRERATVSADVIARYRPGAILDNLGCQREADRYWCYVQALGGGPVGFVAAEYLDPAAPDGGYVVRGVDDSALRAGQGDFDASGQLPCAWQVGQPTTRCDFQVARSGGGYATVVISRPDERTRILYFRFGRPIGTGTSEADNPGEFSASQEADLHFVRVGNERYEIPDAVIFGG